MRDVFDFAKYFIKNGADSAPNSYDGNMKLQKLLILADLINIAEYGEPLFDDEIIVSENGCVVEKIRLKYRNYYVDFKEESDSFQPNFTDEEYTSLNLVNSIFGNASVKELSNITHSFNFWKLSYDNGKLSNDCHNKEKSIIDIMSQHSDLEKMREIISAYRKSEMSNSRKEVINGVTFYYEDLELTDELMEQLSKFALNAEDDTYSIYIDSGRLVIY